MSKQNDHRDGHIRRLTELDVQLVREEDGIHVGCFIRNELLGDLVKLIEMNERLEQT